MSLPTHHRKFFDKIKNVKPVPRGWQCSCPCHEQHHKDPHEPDQHPSMGVMLRDDGWLTVTCFAGCTLQDILSSAGCSMADIGPERPERVERVGKLPIETIYSYKDESGKELYQVLRLKPKDFRQRRADGKGGYIYSLTGCRKVLYRLPELLANAPRQVCLVEGEKDVDNLYKLGAVATCNPCGADAWEDEYTEMLRGRGVVLIPDHDPIVLKTGKRPGWERVIKIAKKLIGVAAFVKILQLDIPEGQDVSDWIAAGGTYEQLAALAKASPVITHPESLPEYLPHGGHDVAPQKPQGRRVRKVKLTAEELSSAAHKGTMRHIHLIKHKDRSHDAFNAWSVQIELACAEQAARKATHRYSVGAVGTYQDKTAERLLQVKYHHTKDELRLTDSDLDDDLFVFVTGVAPCYSVHGWIKGSDGKQEAFKNSEGIYLVPKERLHDVRDLPPELDSDEWDE